MLTTRALHINAEGNYLQAKTPARNTKNRSENAYQGSMTIQNGKGKTNSMRTPFHPKTTQPQRLAKDTPGLTLNKPSIQLVARPNKPLADKTPFANRTLNFAHTPAPDPKVPKPNHLVPITNDQQATPDSGPGSARASSTRRHSRAPKASVTFQTPANKGNHWDVSDGDIVVPEMEQVLEIEEEFDNSEEVEYMPPNTLDLPYHPPFEYDLPNYRLLGQAALRSVYSYANEEPSPPTFDFIFSDQDLVKWDSLSLPSLLSEDESFTLASKGIVNKTTVKSSTVTNAKHATISRPTSAFAPTSRVISRPSTAALTRRPATSVSIKAPTAKPSTTRPVTASTTIRATSTSTIRPASATLRAASCATRKHPVATTSATTLLPRPQVRSVTKPALTSTTRTTATRAAASTLAKPSTTISANVLPPIGRTAISRPATAASTVRPVTSASVRSSSARARAVRPPLASTAPLAISTGSTLKKPSAPKARGISAPASPRLRATGAAGTGTKQLATSDKLSVASQKPDHVNVKPGKAPTVSNVDGAALSCNEIVEVAAAPSEILILDLDAEQLEKAGDQESSARLKSNAMQLVNATHVVAGDPDVPAPPAEELEEDESGNAESRSPTQALAVVDEIVSAKADEGGINPQAKTGTVIGSGETRIGDYTSPAIYDRDPEFVAEGETATTWIGSAIAKEIARNVEESHTYLS